LTTLVIGAARETQTVGEGGGPEKSGLFYWQQFRKDRTSTYLYVTKSIDHKTV
jgi:hypothetical protein